MDFAEASEDQILRVVRQSNTLTTDPSVFEPAQLSLAGIGKSPGRKREERCGFLGNSIPSEKQTQGFQGMRYSYLGFLNDHELRLVRPIALEWCELSGAHLLHHCVQRQSQRLVVECIALLSWIWASRQ